ncbi:MAG: hypothetical protein ACYSYL_21810 [Planctomycetota bacterium]
MNEEEMKRMNRSHLLNRLWNLKVDAIHNHISELQALFQSIGYKRIKLNDEPLETIDVNLILELMFEQVIGRSKSL